MPIMRIKEWREAAGLTQRDLGDRIGVDVTTVTKWETEVALPKTRDIPRLARELHRPIGDLFVLEEGEEPERGPLVSSFDPDPED